VRVCVFGAGAIGGHIAGRLAKGGAEVSLVARGAHLAAIRADGLRVEAPDGDIHCRPAASDDPRTLGPHDAVVVTVKAPALPDVAASIGPLLGPETSVTFVMNGIPWWYFFAHGGAQDGKRLPSIDPGDALWNAVGPERALGGVVNSACTVTSPGVVLVEHAHNRVVLGEPNGAISPRVEGLAAAMRAGGLGAEVTDRIRGAIWGKLPFNLSTGPLAVLVQSSLHDIYGDPTCLAAWRQIMTESLAIAAGVGWPQQIDIDALAKRGGSPHKSSILQDLERGRPMEIAAIYDAPLAMAREAGVATPMLNLLVGLVRVRARAAGLYQG
jgi:2-dehydropantoate 2-reductase